MIQENPIQLPSLLTVRQFSLKHPAFNEGGLRWMIFHAHTNGMKSCIRRLGKKVLINEAAFFQWVEVLNA